MKHTHGPHWFEMIIGLFLVATIASDLHLHSTEAFAAFMGIVLIFLRMLAD